MPNWKKVIVSGSDAVLNSVTASAGFFGTASWANNAVSASNARTASFVNTLNQDVLISGSLTVGTTTAGASENTLTLGPKGTQEGGQLLLQAGTSYTSASMLDMYQDSNNPYFRLLRGSNAGSDAVVAQWNMHTKQMLLPAYNSPTAFTATTLVGLLGFDANGAIITTTTSSGGGGGVTITNNTDNYILTATGVANTINGESGLQFNGSSLTVTGQITSSGAITSQANGAMYFRGGDDAEFWDINVVNTVGIYGQQDQGVASVKLGSGGGTVSGRSGSIGINTTTPNSGALHVSGGVFATSLTGSLLGTASFADRATTASMGDTASYSLTLGASIGQNAAGTVQLRNSAGTTISSINVNTLTASLAFTASYLNPGTYAITSSWAQSASQALTASYIITAQTASYVLQAVSASFASTASSVNTLRQNVILSGSLLVSSSILGSGSFYNTTIDLIGSGVSTNGISSITFGTKYLFDDNNVRSITWGSRQLLDNSQSLSVNWNSRTLASGSTTVLDWSSGTGSLIGTSSWATRAISASFLPIGTYNITSSWAVSASQAISASTATTSSFAISASWAPSVASNPFPFTGSAIISGSLTITGSLQVGVPGASNAAIDTTVGTLSRGASVSIDWPNRYLYNSVGGITVDWENYTLNDNSATPSIDWNNRVLTDPSNVNVAFEYSNSTSTISQLYHRAVIPSQVQRSISDSSSYAGQLIQATIDVGVTNYQLVFLDTDGTWKGTKATVANGANKMLGIAVDTAGGYVLIEGDVGVSDDNSQGGYVVGADHGLPVYVSGNTGEMTTTQPSNVGALVRIVGYIYYQSTTDINWWTMKFRPSSDWYEQ